MADSPFIPETKIQFAWDSTSLGWLKTCPRLYQYTMLEGWRIRQMGLHLIFGLVYASALETFHKARASGADFDEAERRALRHALERTWFDDKPWDSGDTKKNRETLVRSIIWYLEHFREDNLKTVVLPSGAAAVELSFKFEAGFKIRGQEVILCGHLDRLVDYDGAKYVLDNKTTGGSIGGYYFDGYSPHNQMSLYTFAGRVVYNMPISGVIIDAAKILVGSTEFARGFTMRTDAQINEWRDDFMYWVTQAELFADAGYWPMNDTACDKFGGCVFRRVCSKSPEVRQNYLESDFEKNNWNPLESR